MINLSTPERITGEDARGAVLTMEIADPEIKNIRQQTANISRWDLHAKEIAASKENMSSNDRAQYQTVRLSE